MFEQSQRAGIRLALDAKRLFLTWSEPAREAGSFGRWVRGSAQGRELRAVGPGQIGRPGASGGGSVAARGAALDALGGTPVVSVRRRGRPL